MPVIDSPNFLRTAFILPPASSHEIGNVPTPLFLLGWCWSFFCLESPPHGPPNDRSPRQETHFIFFALLLAPQTNALAAFIINDCLSEEGTSCAWESSHFHLFKTMNLLHRGRPPETPAYFLFFSTITCSTRAPSEGVHRSINSGFLFFT